MGVDATSASVQVQANLTCSKNVTGAAYSPNQNNSAFAKKLAFVLGGNLALGVNEIYSAITTIAATGNASIDLTSITDLLNKASVTLVRVKAILVQLLSATDDATNGTAASSVTLDNTVTNGLSAQTHSGWFDNGAEGAAGGSKFTIPNGGVLLFGTPAAAGVVVDATHKVLKIVNNDGGVSAAVQITVFGADA